MRRGALIAALFASAAGAQSAPGLNAQAAQAIIAGCLAHATAHKNQQAVVVVDRGGRVIASLRMDGAGFGKMDFRGGEGGCCGRLGVRDRRAS